MLKLVLAVAGVLLLVSVVASLPVSGQKYILVPLAGGGNELEGGESSRRVVRAPLGLLNLKPDQREKTLTYQSDYVRLRPETGGGWGKGSYYSDPWASWGGGYEGDGFVGTSIVQRPGKTQDFLLGLGL